MNKKHRAIFLDRDGTINKEVDVLRSLTQLRILPGVPEAIRLFNKLGFVVVVITNQPVIARGWLTEKEVKEIHQILLSRLSKKNAKIDAVYFCPHHPEANLKKYRKACGCRKPKPGMLLQAIKDLSIDRKGSFMIGDHATDIMAGKAAGVKTILVRSSERSKDSAYAHIRPDFLAKNLLAASRIIKRHAK